jgi:hypothetical protein
MSQIHKDLILFVGQSAEALGPSRPLKDIRVLFPASLHLGGKDQFACGAAAVLLELYRLICQSPEGRKALADLGFQPFFEQVEGPGGSDRP